MRRQAMRSVILLFILFSQLVMASPESHINEDRAQTNYMLNCQGCHKADGSGLPGSVPGMQDFVGRFLAVPGGRKFLIQVPGSSNSPLSDADLAELLNWILTTMSAGELTADFKFYSEAEVREARGTVLVDVADTRAELVGRMPR